MSKELAQKIKAYRKKKGITAWELAAQLGISSRTIEGWELGKKNPEGLALVYLNKILES